MIQCFNCKVYYALSSINLTTSLRSRISKFICHQCFNETGERTTWDNIMVRQKDIDYFEVFDIRKHKITTRGRSFLVSWAGFPDQYNTWTPEKALDGATSLLDDYLLHNGLQPTKIQQRLGSDLRTSVGDRKNWRTAEDVLSQIRKSIEGKKHFDQTVLILTRAQQLNYSGNSRTISIVDFAAHAFVLLVNPTRACAWIADGTNMCLDKGIQKHFTEFIPPDFKMYPITYQHQVGLDDCTSSAVLIALEMLKLKHQSKLPKTLTPNSYNRNKIRNQLHHGKAYRINPELKLHQLKIPVKCQNCNKTYFGRKANRQAHAHFLNCNRL